MKTFTIDNDNNITAFDSVEEATAATAAPIDSFSNEKKLAELIAGWPAERLVAIWNSLPGVTPVKGFKSHTPPAESGSALRAWATHPSPR